MDHHQRLLLWQIALLVVAHECGRVCRAQDSPLTPETGWALLAWSESIESRDLQKVVIVDLFDQQNMFPSLHADGHLVVCYYSAGTAEDWRADVLANRTAWEAVAVGQIAGWEGEIWLDIRQLDALQALMIPRLDLAASVGCDGVEPDNVDCFSNSECLEGTRSEQLAYNEWTAAYAHGIGLLVGLKNAGDLVSDLVSNYDFSIVESCLKNEECDAYAAFTEQGKPIFGIEYETLCREECDSALRANVMMKYCGGADTDVCRGNSLLNCYEMQDWPCSDPAAVNDTTCNPPASDVSPFVEPLGTCGAHALVSRVRTGLLLVLMSSVTVLALLA